MYYYNIYYNKKWLRLKASNIKEALKKFYDIEKNEIKNLKIVRVGKVI